MEKGKVNTDYYQKIVKRRTRQHILFRCYYKSLLLTLKDKAYQLWHGHPFLLNEEVEIICKTRAEPEFKHFNDYKIQALVKLRIHEMYEKYKRQQKCKHVVV